MKRAALILLALTSVLTLQLLPNRGMRQALGLEATATEISRVISVSNEGLTFVTDEISLKQGSSIAIGIPASYEGSLVEYYSTDRGVTVTRSHNPQYPDVTFLNITSQIPREQITLITILDGLISQDVSGLFNLTLPETPILFQELAMFNLSILLPTDADVKALPVNFNVTMTNQTVMVYTTTTTLKPLAKSELSIQFNSGTIHLFSVNSDEVTIVFNEELDIEEKLSVKYGGSGETDTVSLRIPEESEIRLVKGLIEELDRSVGNESGGLVTVAVKLRQAITNGQNASFVIEYRAPTEAFVERSNGEEVVQFPRSLNTTYGDYKVWMVFPSSYRVKTFVPTPQGFIREEPYRTKIMYERSDTALRIHNSVQLDYEKSFSLSEYYGWIWAAAVVLGAIGVTVRVTHVVGPKPPEITREAKKLVRDTVERYMRVRKLREQLLARGISETREKRRGPVARETLRSIKRDSERMRDTIRRLRKAHPSFVSTLAEIENVEAELQGLLVAYNRVTEDLRRGRISKKVAQRIQKEYRKQVQAHMANEDELIEEVERTVG